MINKITIIVVLIMSAGAEMDVPDFLGHTIHRPTKRVPMSLEMVDFYSLSGMLTAVAIFFG